MYTPRCAQAALTVPGGYTELADLRAKFEEDKAKIEKMKAARKFRPY